MKRLVILISGRGSNLGAILSAWQAGQWPVDIVAVISNRPQAEGLALAQSYGVPVRVVDHQAFDDRAAFDGTLADEISSLAPDLIVLAGFMRILSREFCQAFAGRILNIHPSLLPAFRGMRTHEQALVAGVKVHGCTVHAVTPDLDHGPILAQAVVPVMVDDTVEQLANRVLEMEHRLYPMAIAAVISGRCQLQANSWVDLGRGSFSHEFSPCIVHPSL
jgi:phosphoribosylglycinamide formyltransferase 1